MSKIKFYFILSIATVITIISCNKDDNNADVTPPLPYAEQYPKDSLAINEYLKANYISEVVNKPGLPEDQDVIIKKIDEPVTQKSLWSYLNSPTLPRLSFRNVISNGVTYKVYTLVIREGVGNADLKVGGEYPCNVDGVFVGYKGTLLNGTVFDSNNDGKLWNLDGSDHDGGQGVVRGWSEGFPQLKTGWVSSNADGTLKYNDFGVGVFFIPSGLGYYNIVQGDIPAYSPLVFSVKLYSLKRYDHDADGIPSFQEDKNGDHYVNIFAVGVDNPDDTDKDGTPDFIDFDDDGDGYATRGEIKDKDGKYYSFDLIPDCEGKTDKPDRVKRHLDASCHYINQ